MRYMFVPESVWPLLKWRFFDGATYESVVREQVDVTSPTITIYEPSDDGDDDEKAFDYASVVALIKDGVVDNLIPYPTTERRVGISRNDEQALKDFVGEVEDAWRKCVDRLTVNRIAETSTTRYPIED